MIDTINVKILVEVNGEQWTLAELHLPEDGRFSDLAPTLRRMADDMDAEAAAPLSGEDTP